jgi:hypothetical protein
MVRSLSLMVSRRFDGWVTANVGVAAAAGPQNRWRPHSSNLPMRRRVPLARDERGYKADGTSRDRSPLPHAAAVTMCTQPQRATRRLYTASRFIQANLAPSGCGAPSVDPIPVT